MKKTGLVILGMIVLLIGIISLSKKENKVLVEEINNQNTSLVFMLQDKEGNYNKSEELPSSGYSFNTSKSVCSNNATPTWEDNKLYLNNLSKNGTSCYLYFDRMGAKDIILSNSKVNEGTPDFSQIATTDEGIYEAEDDWGTSYYFRGAVENNWLKFGGYYWRIIRINGDGSIRVIYNGTSTETIGDSTMINSSQAFNSSYNRSEYVGYMYTINEQHGNTTNSPIKTVVDNWYTANIANRGFSQYVSTEAGFCGDRNLKSGSWSSESEDTIYYKAYGRIIDNKTPSLKCSNSNDLYTVSGSSKGNKALSNPVGLITVDEVAMIGGVYEVSNSGYYLYNKKNYWTMSPSFFNGISGTMFIVSSNGDLEYSDVRNAPGVRPVINISSDVEITGSGTSDDPYVVVGAE